MASEIVLSPLGFSWRTRDPFLFCVHHLDHYPRGNERLGPSTSLSDRTIGMDFELRDGWRMYHGEHVPGFPAHPHRGFETVTLARRGFIDHSDSLGATARFGEGDVQWMTAGRGIVHSEMFPLLDPEAPNPLELFQIWLNLPRRDKMVEPHFSMLWSHQIPKFVASDASARRTEVTIVAGAFAAARGPKPPPRSWASDPEHDVMIWTLHMEPYAEFTLPAAMPNTNRSLYFYSGSTISIDDVDVDAPSACEFAVASSAVLRNGAEPSEFLLLQGQPIREPVVQHGPFVMNTRQEISQAILDYQRTQFGGWPWADAEPIHARDAGRFARHADGRDDRPSSET
ncbi:MAG: pirin family protein [Deltaproteobacteria bacterium]|nr:pirin family protein [Deltaproteobacteria bacterium]